MSKKKGFAVGFGLTKGDSYVKTPLLLKFQPTRPIIDSMKDSEFHHEYLQIHPSYTLFQWVLSTLMSAPGKDASTTHPEWFNQGGFVAALYIFVETTKYKSSRQISSMSCSTQLRPHSRRNVALHPTPHRRDGPEPITPTYGFSRPLFRVTSASGPLASPNIMLRRDEGMLWAEQPINVDAAPSPNTASEAPQLGLRSAP
ncbi:hypothetical protein B0H19DRAFT_1321614 [Mycena capillaripes]|nr:hypothetical protein B0H19DRAFT_1321614 [Mycena capillaripes]